MSPCAVTLNRKALDWLEDCRDAKLKRRIGQAIDALAMNPRPPGGVKLTGEENAWRIRVGTRGPALGRTAGRSAGHVLRPERIVGHLMNPQLSATALARIRNRQHQTAAKRIRNQSATG